MGDIINFTRYFNAKQRCRGEISQRQLYTAVFSVQRLLYFCFQLFIYVC